MKRFVLIAAVIVLFCIVTTVLYGTFADKRRSRITIVVASSPLTLWSWDTTQNTFVVLQIPADYVLDAAFGYGVYTLESLWKLGFIDNRSGTLLTKSLEHLLGTEVRYYVGEQADGLVKTSDPYEYGKNLFSPAAIVRLTTGALKTNSSLATYIKFVRAARSVRPEAILVLDMTELPVFIQQELPDGTKQKQIERGNIDAVLKGKFEIDVIGQERISVVVLNTTDTTALGTQAARMLTNIGALVVSVGNANDIRDTCLIKGSKTALESRTAQEAKAMFDCDELISSVDERADIELYLGRSYAQQFIGKQ